MSTLRKICPARCFLLAQMGKIGGFSREPDRTGEIFSTPANPRREQQKGGGDTESRPESRPPTGDSTKGGGTRSGAISTYPVGPSQDLSPRTISGTERGPWLLRQRVVEGVGEQLDRSVDLVAGGGPTHRKANRPRHLRRGRTDRPQDLSHLIRGVIRSGAGHGQLTRGTLDFSRTDLELHRDRIREPRRALTEDFRSRINGR